MQQDIIQSIDQYAENHPDWPAVDVLGTITTYGQLKQQSDALAAFLSTQNLPAKSPIMVYCDQSATTIATFLGCVKAGHAYIPVDTHSPNERLVMINEIAKPAMTIGVANLPVSLDSQVLTPMALQQVLSRPQLPKALNPVSGDDNFYIIFTSGTTGQPKGVQISDANVNSFVNWMQTFDLPKRPKMLSQAPYSFDLSVMDLYPALTAGGCVMVLPKATTDNLKAMFTALPKMGLDVWVSTPSFMEICLLDPSFDAAHYPDLSQIYFCGEELTHSTAAKILQRFPDVRLYNTYGPTETCVAVTAVQIDQALLAKFDRLPIGYAKPDTQITLKPGTVRQEDGHEIGELLIAGPTVSKGYLNRPEKTAAAFSTLANGSRAYASGDLGYIAENGLIFYRGRTDFQIKLNGYRIELEEVDHFLNAESLIRQGVAVPKYNQEHKVVQMLAYVVPEKNDFPSELALTKAIKKHLNAAMMSYMVPQRFIYRDKLPLTQNGKVAVKALIQEVNGK